MPVNHSLYSTPSPFRFQQKSKPPPAAFTPNQGSFKASNALPPSFSTERNDGENSQLQSQFARTPRFTVPSSSASIIRYHNTLDNGDPDLEVQDSSPLATRTSPKLTSRTGPARREADAIEDDDDDRETSPLQSCRRPNPDDQSGRPPKNLYSSTEQDHIPENPSPAPEPHQSQKRRRLHYHSDSSAESTSSSPSPSPVRDPILQGGSSTHAPHFVFPTHAVDPSAPSFATPTIDPTPSKPTFILPQSVRPRNDNLDILTLSPSHRDRRRRAGPRYLPNGMADMVRTWVLELASQTLSPSKGNVSPRRAHSNADEQWLHEKFQVTEIGSGDNAGAGVTAVKDTKGRKWLLVGESMKANRDMKGPKIIMGCLVGVKKGSATWKLDLPDSQELHQQGIADQSVNDGKLSSWTVALEWDVLSS